MISILWDLAGILQLKKLKEEQLGRRGDETVLGIMRQ